MASSVYKSVKIVHTGLYGEKAFAVLDNAVLLMSRIKGSTGRVFRYAYAERACDNEIIINFKYPIDRWSTRSPWELCNNPIILSMPDAQIKAKLADRLKKTIRDRCYAWDRSSREQYTRSLTVGDVYSVYDCLNGRIRQIRKFSDGRSEEIIGHAFDPVTAELEQAKRDEIARIEQKYFDDRKAYQDGKSLEIDQLNAEIREIYRKIEKIRNAQDEHVEQMEAEKDAAIKKLTEEIDTMIKGQPAGESVAV